MPLIWPGVAGIQGHIYLFGGYFYGGVKDAIQKYTIQNDTWITLQQTLPTKSYTNATAINQS